MIHLVCSNNGSSIMLEPCDCCSNTTLNFTLANVALLTMTMNLEALELLKEQIEEVIASHTHQGHEDADDEDVEWESAVFGSRKEAVSMIQDFE